MSETTDDIEDGIARAEAVRAQFGPDEIYDMGDDACPHCGLDIMQHSECKNAACKYCGELVFCDHVCTQ